MTDHHAHSDRPQATSLHTRAEARDRLKSRYASEKRFKWMGAGAVLIALSFLVILLSTVVTQGLPAFRANYVILPIDLTAEKVDPSNPREADYTALIRQGLTELFPKVTGRKAKRKLRNIVSSGSGVLLRRSIEADPSILGSIEQIAVPADDVADLYLKGHIIRQEVFLPTVLPKSLSRNSGNVEVVFSTQELIGLVKDFGGVADADNAIAVTELMPSVLLYLNEGAVKLTKISETSDGAVVASGHELEELHLDAESDPFLRVIGLPESQRKISDAEILWLDKLSAEGRIENRWSTNFLMAGASREPELAGIWGALTGSFLTMIVTLALSFPIGVGAAVYLEEFAPKNRLTRMIEVNINNLAAVPSIVFGLLGLAVFLNWFALPRSAALVGGMVLALMTLPTIIIASRAALRAVPPSIREAALGVGASKIQTVFHHVLPLAMPGILTGTIIGMAQALGETAPLLMIGMVAFIVDIPGSFTDPATVLPVQVFMWADFPEPAFRQKTAAAILVLLGFLVLMNAIAVILRRRIERRW